MKDNQKSDHQTHYMPIGMSIGLCIGALMDGQNRKMEKGASDRDKDETE